MILDRIEHAASYRGMGRGVAEALDFLRKTNLAGLAVGRHEIDGDRLFAIVQRYRPRLLSEAIWEAHRRYIDVQYVVEGAERMGYAPLAACTTVHTPYDAAKDAELFTTQGGLFEAPAGTFAVFAPQDVHAPGLALDPPAPGEVLKIVLKIAVEA